MEKCMKVAWIKMRKICEKCVKKIWENMKMKIGFKTE